MAGAIISSFEDRRGDLSCRSGPITAPECLSTSSKAGKRTIEGVAPEIELQDVVHPGLLQADDAAYLSVLQRWHWGPGETEVLAIVTGLTLVRGQADSVTVAATYRRPRATPPS